MKKTIILFILFLFYPKIIAQNLIQLDEVIINNNFNSKQVIKKIKKSLIKNSKQGESKYILLQNSTNYYDTIVNKKEVINLEIKSYENNFTKKVLSTINKSPNKTDSLFYKFTEIETPNHWISNMPIIKNINIINLDFLKNSKNYSFSLSKGAKFSIIKFWSNEYTGEFQYNNKNYNISFLKYKNTIPHSNSQVNKNKFNKAFESEWIEKTEDVNLVFSEFENKIILDSMIIFEEIEGFEFKKYDKRGNVINSGNFNFKTKISLYNDKN
ncbi:hypothetical protein LIS90_12330 [Flavobacterium psychrophilum]|uniref:hypothetical protein n=1 Tax=Flavobacterium psychrophilum TaxID=96345 RepID=UPI000B7C52B4|nr:hypothetical protein [Flavobacterium psychrophilum]MCB6089588.1 hypothetical protein [Flavobacterium psychrophilum]MCB6232034.1 hypothetical protein [Flavobacterium psychrophilum]MEB3380542.1 hypothetical protein [Flavobacterium psychrophilum]SNA87994.1 hypothetical protein FI146_730001 [Flavobacterium psychrophilum]